MLNSKGTAGSINRGNDGTQQFNRTVNQFNQTAGSLSTNPASLKTKLVGLEEVIKAISDELNLHKKEVQILRSEKDTLESVLSMKTQDVKKTLTNEMSRIEEEMKRHFAHQKAENSRIQQLSLIHISEPTRQAEISYAVFCLKKKKRN
eukprot:TRINITY_DN9929_c0_g2_i1.p1 TRINITY_DN9929_c0_g2~~TRINITY_DN9929_c0_g2_i1.p1  ORF type:complete len:148 (+),score=42.12 TRINITY_DN9929_c0_g2_i1:135-578(+)